ncbi:MAG: HDOD domain-containing protein [Nitrospirota bacterium]|nr:HDOD domain-containing protein [Nitrospirota bacterium]
MMGSAIDLIKTCETLPSLPEAYFRIQQIVNDPEGSMLDLAKAISIDPALTARVLKLVNSAFYDMPRKVETVSRAASMLGMFPIHDLVLATSVTNAFSNMTQTIMDMKTFWRQSVVCGLLARELGKQAGLLDSERLFVEGLLCDIGHLVMYIQIPGPAQAALSQHQETGRPLFEIERERLGFDFAEVGAGLLEEWNLPQNFQEALRAHTDFQGTTDYALEAGMLHVAGSLTRNHTIDETQPQWPTDVNANAWEITGLTEDCLIPVLEAVRPQLDSVLGLIIQAR